MIPVQKKLVKTYERHSGMLQCMAETIGVDLGKAMLRHDMQNFPYRDMVFRCSRCTGVDACQAWLSDYKGPVSETPEYCRNKAILERLRTAEREEAAAG